VAQFLGFEGALAIHRVQIGVFGGAPSLRDAALLQSSLSQAEQTFAYTHDLFDAAAQYCFSVARNHPFLDGNKRAGAACMLTFLMLNKIEPTMSPAELFELTMRVAIGKLTRADLAAFLRQHSRHVK